MAEKTAFLEVDLPFGKSVFYSLDEIDEWVQKEIAFWKWPPNFGQSLRRELNLEGIINSIISPLSSIQSAINSIKRIRPDQKQENLVANLRNEINAAYSLDNPSQPKKYELLHSSQPRAQFIQSLIEASPIRAACVAIYFMRVPIDNPLHPAVLDGAVTGVLYDHGIKGACEAEKASLEQLRAEWNKELLKARKINEDNALTAKDWKIQTGNDQSQQQTTFQELLNKSKSDIDLFKQRISAEIALKGPVTYWQEKARKHTVKSRWFLGFTISAFVGVSVYIGITIHFFAPNLAVNEITLRHIGLLAVGATVGVWFIRVLVRNYLSHVHLSHDADERVAMMKTYLALLEEGKLEDKYRNLILQALFRPASTGIVKDDAAPPFMAEWLKRTTGTDG